MIEWLDHDYRQFSAFILERLVTADLSLRIEKGTMYSNFMCSCAAVQVYL